MEVDVVSDTYGGGRMRRKTPFQLQSLEKFYGEEKYPAQKAMEAYAASLKLTYEQVYRWFVERRRKDKRNVGAQSHFSKKHAGTVGSQIWNIRNLTSRGTKRNKVKHKAKEVVKREMRTRRYHANENPGKPFLGRKNYEHAELFVLDLNQIVYKIFRDDGPPLGIEFDCLPRGAFGSQPGLHHCRCTRQCVHNVAEEGISEFPYVFISRSGKWSKPHVIAKNPTRFAREKYHTGLSVPMKKYGMGKGLVSAPGTKYGKGKVLMHAPVKKYGVGKGLMTVWSAVNSSRRSFSEGSRQISKTSVSKNRLPQKPRKSQNQRVSLKHHKLGNSVLERGTSLRISKAECYRYGVRKVHSEVACELATENFIADNRSSEVSELVDDEELELSELAVASKSFKCSAHLAEDDRHGCSLCKDLLVRFPPHCVKMAQPLSLRPWDSSTDMVKKLFTIFRFLYTHAVVVNMFPFTIDDLVQAFHDKDSVLLGNIHVSLLEFLFSSTAKRLDHAHFPGAPRDTKFREFLHSVRYLEINVQFLKTCLNSLTWIEILRQVLIAAGFGAKKITPRGDNLSMEGGQLERFGLQYGTLKGEVFSILFERGRKGTTVFELANSHKVSALKLSNNSAEVEDLTRAVLSGDVTLFEKISHSSYRLRLNHLLYRKEVYFHSDNEDLETVEFDSLDSRSDCSSDDADVPDGSIVENGPHISNGCREKCCKNMLEYNEIDESHSGDMWMLGLMEAEYSDLTIEEKLNALTALIGLIAAGSGVGVEDPANEMSDNISDIYNCHSGAKMKKLTKSTLVEPLVDHLGSMQVKKLNVPLENITGMLKKGSYIHSSQCIYLGSDRRYNNYWLFLGPCAEQDPGHRRVYFESSEDGHWEVIDTKEALCALLSVLDSRGKREAHLLASLLQKEAPLCRAMTRHTVVAGGLMPTNRSASEMSNGEGSSPFSDVDNGINLSGAVCSIVSSGATSIEQKGHEKRQMWDRRQEFDSWVWTSFYNSLNAVKFGKRHFLDSFARCGACHDLYWRDEKHCSGCHTTFELGFDMEERYAVHTATCRGKDACMNDFPGHRVLPSQLQSLKAALHAIEAVMPEDALLSAWRRSAHKLWTKRLRRTSSLTELILVIKDFVDAINQEWLGRSSVILGSYSPLEEIVLFFPTLQTTSAVAVWLVKLDRVLAPCL